MRDLPVSAESIWCCEVFPLNYPRRLRAGDGIWTRVSRLSILKNLRRKGQNVPVILLTARNKLDDRPEGLNLGADADEFLLLSWKSQ